MAKTLDLTKTKVLVDGNSLTVWGGVSLSNKLAVLLPGADCVNFGVSGQTTSQMLSDQQSQVIAAFDTTKTNVVVALEMGNHMAVDGASATLAHSSYRQYCLNARAAGAYVVACTVFDRRNSNGNEDALRPKIVEANQLIRNYWPSYANTLVDAPAAVGAVFNNAENRGWWPDGVHYSEQAYDKFAVLLANNIKKILTR